MADDTELGVYLQRIDPERREAYLRAHDDVPVGVTEAMERGGVVDFRLFVRGDVAVCVVEAEDLDAYVSAVADDPAVEAWERRVAAYKREGVDPDADPDEQIPFMDEVWAFEPGEGDGSEDDGGEGDGSDGGQGGEDG